MVSTLKQTLKARSTQPNEAASILVANNFAAEEDDEYDSDEDDSEDELDKPLTIDDLDDDPDYNYRDDLTLLNCQRLQAKISLRTTGPMHKYLKDASELDSEDDLDQEDDHLTPYQMMFRGINVPIQKLPKEVLDKPHEDEYFDKVSVNKQNKNNPSFLSRE